MSDNNIEDVQEAQPKPAGRRKVSVKGPVASLVLNFCLVAVIALCVGFLGGFMWGYDRGINMPVTIYEDNNFQE